MMAAAAAKGAIGPGEDSLDPRDNLLHCSRLPILDDDAFQDFEYSFAYSCPRKLFQHVTLKIDTFMM